MCHGNTSQKSINNLNDYFSSSNLQDMTTKYIKPTIQIKKKIHCKNIQKTKKSKRTKNCGFLVTYRNQRKNIHCGLIFFTYIKIKQTIENKDEIRNKNKNKNRK